MQLGIIVIHRKHYANSCIVKAILRILGEVDRVHFEVRILPIDGMLRLCMKMELGTIELFACAEDLLGDVGREHHRPLYLSTKINLHSMPVEFGLRHKRILVYL